jgi:hypothetical protein
MYSLHCTICTGPSWCLRSCRGCYELAPTPLFAFRSRSRVPSRVHRVYVSQPLPLSASLFDANLRTEKGAARFRHAMSGPLVVTVNRSLNLGGHHGWANRLQPAGPGHVRRLGHSVRCLAPGAAFEPLTLLQDVFDRLGRCPRDDTGLRADTGCISASATTIRACRSLRPPMRSPMSPSARSHGSVSGRHARNACQPRWPCSGVRRAIAFSRLSSEGRRTVGMFVVGAGSFLFHATLRYEAQLADELRR